MKKNVNPQLIFEHEMRKTSPLLKDIYPSVSGIAVKYRKMAGNEGDAWRTWNISPDSHFYYTLSCVNIECVGGGYNLTDIIRGLITSGKDAITGKALCTGWEDRERIGSFHCYSCLDYEITISRYPESTEGL